MITNFNFYGHNSPIQACFQFNGVHVTALKFNHKFRFTVASEDEDILNEKNIKFFSDYIKKICYKEVAV